MATDRDIFAEAARLTDAGVGFVLATVIGTKGSSPRNAGAKMIWRPVNDAAGLSGDQTGTIGGGQFEMLVAESAARVFASRGTATEHYVLGAEAEQCCGGAMDVFLEYCGSRQRLVVFGAGHVAHAIMDVLRGSPLELVVVDDRAEWNSAERFAAGVRRVLSWDEGVRVARERAGETLACVMTCSHDTDLELLKGLLATRELHGNSSGAATLSAEWEKNRGLAPLGSDLIPAFVGLIGSRSKRVCLFGRLISWGIDEELVKRVQCPIGVGNTGKEPRMVAVSIAAGVLLEARRMEEQRGAAGVRGQAGRGARASEDATSDDAPETRAGEPVARAEVA